MDEYVGPAVGPAMPAAERLQASDWPAPPTYRASADVRWPAQPALPSDAARAISDDTCAMLNDILSTRHRRPRGLEHLSPGELPWFMWKTGTSSGRRDALAVGHNGKVAIGVWIGRASGAGDVSYVGVDAAEPLLSQLFNVASLRQPLSPPPARSWLVAQPLPPPIEQAARLSILSPRHGSQFVAIDGEAIIHPRLNRDPAGPSPQWFLNGRLIDPAAARRLTLTPGGYELRCVEASGESARVDFVVR